MHACIYICLSACLPATACPQIDLILDFFTGRLLDLPAGLKVEYTPKEVWWVGAACMHACLAGGSVGRSLPACVCACLADWGIGLEEPVCLLACLPAWPGYGKVQWSVAWWVGCCLVGSVE